MKKLTGLMIVALVLLLSINSFAEDKVRVGGSGGMIPLLSELAKDFMATHKDKVIMVNQQSLQTKGGIMGVSEGRLDIGMANRAFKDDEKALGLTEIEIARVAVVIGAQKNLGLKAIISDNLCRVYEGKITNAQELGGANEKMLVITKSEQDATKETIRKGIKCFKDLKEPGSITMIPTSPETARALSNSKAIGFTDMVTVDEMKGAITALMLDGIEPSVENVKTGKYKLAQTYKLVIKGAPIGTIKEFIDYIKSPKGSKVIEANKAIPIK